MSSSIEDHRPAWVMLIASCLRLSPLALADDGQFNSYAAHIAAAEKAIRLNEPAEARRWLDGAPHGFRGWEWHFLNARLDESLSVAETGEERITAFAVSRDGKSAASADVSGRISLWKLPEFSMIRGIEGHENAVYALAFNHDGSQLASVSRDVTSRTWDVATGKELSRIALDNPGVASAAFSPDGSRVATCSWTSKEDDARVRGVVWIWEAATGAIIHRTLVGIKPLDSIAFSPDGARIVVGSWDGLVHVLDGDGREVRTLEMPDENVYNAVIAVAVSPDGKHVAVGSKDRTSRVFELETGSLVATLRGHDGFVNAVTFDPTGEQLATGSVDATVRQWDWPKESETALWRGHLRSVDEATWSASPSRILTVSRDKTFRSWDPASTHGGQIAVNIGVSGTYTSTFTPDGEKVLVAGHDGRVFVIHARTGTIAKEWQAHEDSTCNTLSVTGDGRYVLTCSWDKTAKLWELDKARLVKTFDAGDGVYDCAVSPDGAWAALAAGPAVQLWDARRGERVATFKGHEDSVREVTFSDDGRWLASASGDKTTRVWDITSKAVRSVLIGFDAGCGAADFSPKGGRLAIADDSGTVRLGHLATGVMSDPVFAGDSRPNRLAFSPDGSRLAVAGAGIDIIDVAHGSSVLHLQPHRDTVWHLSFSPDGRRLASCSWNGTIVISETAALRDRRVPDADDHY